MPMQDYEFKKTKIRSQRKHQKSGSGSETKANHRASAKENPDCVG
jgi:hypothetical protein